MIVVSDASPLISLAAVERFHLLQDLYREILIPEFVRREIAEAGLDRVGSAELREADWIVARKVKNDFLLRALEGELDRGEAEAIVLAVELRADLLLIDERRGRTVAERFGFKVVGVLGVLIQAKRMGFLPDVGTVLEDLLARAGFRIAPALRQRVLEEAGEV